MNVFDILGPVMIGPSSSHTAGAARIGLMTRALLGKTPVKAHIFTIEHFVEYIIFCDFLVICYGSQSNLAAGALILFKTSAYILKIFS